MTFAQSVPFIPLGEFLSQSDHSGSAVVFAENEALLLLESHSSTDRRRALRLFISGLPYLKQREHYYRILQGGSAPTETFAMDPMLSRYLTDWPNGSLPSRPVAVSLKESGEIVTGILGCQPGRLNIIQEMREISNDPWAIGLRLCKTRVATPNLRCVAAFGTNESWGANVDESIAREAAISEAIERWALADVPSQLIQACAADLGIERVLDPDKVTKYSPEFLRSNAETLRQFDWSEQREWVVAESDDAGKKYVLADLVYNPYQNRAGGDSRVHTHISTSGMAAHPISGVAQEKAFLELVERDALLCAWIDPSRATLLDKNSLPELLRSSLTTLDPDVSSINLMCLDSPYAHVLMAVLQRAKGGVCIGLAAELDPMEASRKAITELLVCYWSLRNEVVELDYRDVREPIDHARHALTPLGGSEFTRRMASVKVDNFSRLDSPMRRNQIIRTFHIGMRTSYFFKYRNVHDWDRAIWRCLNPSLSPIYFGRGNLAIDTPSIARILQASLHSYEGESHVYPHPLG